MLLVFVKANRDPGAWLIFIPLLIVNLLWSVLTRFLGAASANMAMFSMLFHSHVIGIAALWLLGHKIGNRNRLVTFLLALAIMAVAGLTGVTSYGMTGFSEETAAVLMLLAVLTFTMLLGFALTGWRCRNRYSNLRFMLWLAFWLVVACVASTLTFYSVMFAIYQIPLSILTILLQLSIIALVLGLRLGCFPSAAKNRSFSSLAVTPDLPSGPRPGPSKTCTCRTRTKLSSSWFTLPRPIRIYCKSVPWRA